MKKKRIVATAAVALCALVGLALAGTGGGDVQARIRAAKWKYLKEQPARSSFWCGDYGIRVSVQNPTFSAGARNGALDDGDGEIRVRYEYMGDDYYPGQDVYLSPESARVTVNGVALEMQPVAPGVLEAGIDLDRLSWLGPNDVEVTGWSGTGLELFTLDLTGLLP